MFYAVASPQGYTSGAQTQISCACKDDLKWYFSIGLRSFYGQGQGTLL